MSFHSESFGLPQKHSISPPSANNSLPYQNHRSRGLSQTIIKTKTKILRNTKSFVVLLTPKQLVSYGMKKFPMTRVEFQMTTPSGKKLKNIQKVTSPPMNLKNVWKTQNSMTFQI